MVLKYLTYMLAVLMLLTSVSAGTYTNSFSNGVYKVVEIGKFSTKLVREEQPKEQRRAEVYTSKELSFDDEQQYQTCYMTKPGCVTCELDDIKGGYGNVKTYYNTYHNPNAENRDNVYVSRFRDDYQGTPCDY